jgi:hypothetical protein
MDNYHLTPDGDQWKLKREGAERATRAFDSKSEGVRESTEFMREHGGSLKIHKGDGTIQEERTYPRHNDPPKSKG